MARLRLRTRVVLSIVTVASGLLFGVRAPNTTAYAQSDQKIIQLGNGLNVNRQVELKELKVRGSARKFGEAFGESGDWLEQISFKVGSVTNKKIVYMSINMFFPETRATGNIMVYPLTFGQLPGAKVNVNAPWELAPKGTEDVSLEGKYPAISRFIGHRQDIALLGQIKLEVNFLVFDDGTGWMLGTFMVQDPNKPSLWVPAPVQPTVN